MVLEIFRNATRRFPINILRKTTFKEDLGTNKCRTRKIKEREVYFKTNIVLLTFKRKLNDFGALEI